MATITELNFKHYCRFCDKKNPVSWKCLFCQDIYCHDCKKVHEKFSISKDHIIVSLARMSDPVMVEQKLKILSAVKKQGKCDLFCVTCKVRVNEINKLEDHVEHQLDRYDSFQKVLDVKIESLTAKVNSELAASKHVDSKPKLVDKKEMKKLVQERYDEIVECCKVKAKALQNEIDTFYKNKEKESKDATVQLNRERAKLLKAKEKLCSLQHKGDNSTTLQDAFQELNEQWKQYSSVLPKDESLTFQAGNERPVEIATKLGCLSYSSIAPGIASRRFRLQLIDIIDPTSLQIISRLNPCGENQACIGGIKSKTIQLVDLSEPAEALNEIKITFYDFATSSDGSLLYITDYENKSIKTLSKDGDLKTIKSISPLFPTCVHVTSKDEVFVGIIESDSKNLDAESKRAIIKLTAEGSLRVKWEFDNKGVRIFTVPYRCCYNEVSNQIVVIDTFRSTSGRVIGMSESGDVKFRYTGTGSDLKNRPFLPTDITCTKTGETLICDIDNHSIHILDKFGEFTQNISTLEAWILHPNSLAIDTQGLLWIGTGPPAKETQKGQIYKTSLTINK